MLLCHHSAPCEGQESSQLSRTDYSLWISQLGNISTVGMEASQATLVIRRRSNSTVATLSAPRSRCHSVHVTSFSQRLVTNKQQTRQTRPATEEKRGKLSTFSFRSRASSLSSFSSGTSGASSSSGAVLGYNTEIFWNRYRRSPDNSAISNFFRKSKFRKVTRDKKYSSAFDLLSTSLDE